jgi:hypothetical protein
MRDDRDLLEEILTLVRALVRESSPQISSIPATQSSDLNQLDYDLSCGKNNNCQNNNKH